MTETTPPPEPDDMDSPTDDELDERILAEHQSIPLATRQEALARDAYRCRIDGCRSTEHNGSARLVVQRISEQPHNCSPDDVENVTTYCLRCARWVEQMPSRDDLPPVLQHRLDGADLKTTRVEILRYLHEHGPASTSEVTEHVGLANTVSVRRALYDLMSLDVRDDAIDGRLVVKDRLDETYGLPWQVPDERDARGVIPLQPNARRSRILDAIVDRLLDTLEGRVDNPREVVADIVDRDVSQTYHMQRRARAFQFPFEDWAATSRPRHDEAAAIEAVSIFAATTDNVSRRLAAEPLVEVLERNDERELATLLRQYLLSEETELPFDALTRQASSNSTTDQHTESRGTTEPTELQIFDGPDSDAPDTKDMPDSGTTQYE